MFNVSVRKKTAVKDRLKMLQDIETSVKNCSQCSLSTQRTHALAGRFVEPMDAVIVDILPSSSEDKTGSLLSGDRAKGFGKLFACAKPTIDLDKVSFVTVYKCYGSKPSSNFCLSYLNSQLQCLDPVLIIVFGKEALQLISGKADLELGSIYVTGENSEFLLIGLLHPRDIVVDKEVRLPIWKQQLETLASVALKYDLKIFKT